MITRTIIKDGKKINPACLSFKGLSLNFKCLKIFGFIITTPKLLYKANVSVDAIIVHKEHELILLDKTMLYPKSDKVLKPMSKEYKEGVLQDKYYQNNEILGIYDIVKNDNVVVEDTNENREEMLEQVLCDQEFTDEDYMERRKNENG